MDMVQRALAFFIARHITLYIEFSSGKLDLILFAVSAFIAFSCLIFKSLSANSRNVNIKNSHQLLLMGARDVVLAETENAICGVWQYYSHNQAGYSLNFSSLFLFTKVNSFLINMIAFLLCLFLSIGI